MHRGLLAHHVMSYHIALFFGQRPRRGRCPMVSPYTGNTLPAGSEHHPALFKTLLASPEDLDAASMANFVCSNGHHQTNFKFNIYETSQAEGIADHVTLLRLF